MKTILFSFIFCLIHVCVTAQPGTLDSSFGVDGKVFTSSASAYLDCTSGAALHDGSLIAIGSISFINGIDTGGFFALKYTPDGVPDSSFGTGGRAVVSGIGYARAVAVQPDDKIIICGYGSDFIASYISVARLNPDGSPDLTFGSGGKVISTIGEVSNDIALQRDGKILISGANGTSFVTLRYLPNGTLDESFGNNGAVITGFAKVAVAYTNAVQPDGKIIVTGGTGDQNILIRYNADGTLDQTFGVNGI